MATKVIDRGRGPEIVGTRVTVYRIMDFLREGSAPDHIARELKLTSDQLRAAIDYIELHRVSVERQYEEILARVRQPNPPEVKAGRARSIEELQRRMTSGHRKDAACARAGRQ